MIRAILIAFCVITSVLICVSAGATDGAGKAGNGGHVIVCKRTFKTPKYQLLDIYEANKGLGTYASFLPQTEYEKAPWQYRSKRISIAELRLSAVLPLDHPIMTSFRKAQDLSDFVKLDFGVPGNVDDTKDVGKVWARVPKNCRLQQLAIRTNIDGQDTIIINKSLYEALGKTNRAAFFIHEALHDYFGSQKTTLAVREVVWWLSASEEFRRANGELIVEVINSKAPIDPRLFKTP